MNFEYSKLGIIARKIYRKISPVPASPWTRGEVDDLCSIELVPKKKLNKFFAKCIKRLANRREEGQYDYLEFGVFNGSSISAMFHTQRKLNINMRLFGFDAFEGLPAKAELEDDGVWKKGFYACSYEKMLDCLKSRNVDKNQITFVKGWYNKTLSKEKARELKLNPGIIFIDCDTYSSSKSVLSFVGPLIQEPTIFCFDDWKLFDLDIKEMGEYKAFNEFLKENNHLTAKRIKSYNRKSKTFLVKPRKWCGGRGSNTRSH